MTTDELEKIVARHEMQGLELKESFNVECIETLECSRYAEGYSSSTERPFSLHGGFDLPTHRVWVSYTEKRMPYAGKE